MSTIASTALTNHNSLLRLSVIGGLICGAVDVIIYHWFVQNVLSGVPLIIVYQYIASGALGESAFAGGIPTALLGALFHFIFSIVIAGVFILGVNRIPLLRRHIIPGSLLYGFGVYIVMNMIVIPLSATPPLPTPTMTEIIIGLIVHILVAGLLLGIVVRRNTR
jgi:hypothetical protein